MARATNNPLLQGISGKIGSLVLRQVNGQTIVQAAEAKGKRAPRSPNPRLRRRALMAKHPLTRPDICQTATNPAKTATNPDNPQRGCSAS